MPSLLSLRDELDMGLVLGMSDFSLSLLSGGDRLAKRRKREKRGKRRNIKDTVLLAVISAEHSAKGQCVSLPSLIMWEKTVRQLTCMLASQGSELDSLSHGAHLFLLE